MRRWGKTSRQGGMIKIKVSKRQRDAEQSRHRLTEPRYQTGWGGRKDITGGKSTARQSEPTREDERRESGKWQRNCDRAKKKSCQGWSYWGGGPGVDGALKDGGPQSKLLCAFWDIYVGSWQEIRLDLEPIWIGIRTTCPRWRSSLRRGANRAPARHTCRRSIYSSYMCRCAFPWGSSPAGWV